MDGWLDGWMDGWLDGRMNGWMDRQIDTCRQMNGLNNLEVTDIQNFLFQDLTDHKYRSEAAIRELKAKLRGSEEVMKDIITIAMTNVM